jgi:hypothetical protein
MRRNAFGTSASSGPLIPATDDDDHNDDGDDNDGDNICDSESDSGMQIGIGNRIPWTTLALMPV